jgi:hypothetical protein
LAASLVEIAFGAAGVGAEGDEVVVPVEVVAVVPVALDVLDDPADPVARFAAPWPRPFVFAVVPLCVAPPAVVTGAWTVVPPFGACVVLPLAAPDFPWATAGAAPIATIVATARARKSVMVRNLRTVRTPTPVPDGF